MRVSDAKRLGVRSTFYTPTRNTHNPSGYRLQVVIARDASGLVCMDEFGYKSAWLWSNGKDFAGARLDFPIGSTDSAPIIRHIESIGLL